MVTGRFAGAAAGVALEAAGFGVAALTAGFAAVPVREAVSFAGDFFSGIAVESAGCSAGALCSSSVNLSGFLLGKSEMAPVDLVKPAVVPLASSARATELSSGEAIVFLVWWLVGSETASVSLLKRRLEMLDSPLWSLFNPMRPPFSTATKFVLTLESGLGASAEGVGGAAPI